MKISVIILAAGKGTRMHSKIPKVLHQICGKPILFYIIQKALKYSDDVHVVLAHQAQMIEAQLLREFQSLKLHLQNIEQYAGTAGALMKEKQQEFFGVKNERVLILNGDMPLIDDTTILNILDHHEPLVIGALHLDDPSGYGRIILKDHCVKGIIEEKDCTTEQKQIKSVNAGIYAINQKLLEEFIPCINNENKSKEFYLTDIVKIIVQKDLEVKVVMGDDKSLMGINNKFELCKAQEIMLERLRERAMVNGVLMHLPHTIYLEEDVEFVGECELQEGVRISGKTRIVNSIIKSHSIIEDSIIEDSKIGPLAHIRPKSMIKNTQIGNFVEVKAGKLNGVKAGHLSYLGDCEIDEGSNIGAGVITCNFDGVKKHKTLIGKNVFVGSDCQLIAPLKIESEVFIGAGSTINKDCAKGDFALSRTNQRNLSGGYEKFFKKNK